MPTMVLRRRLFGFKPQQVHAIIADRDFAVGKALERAQALERELEQARERVKAADQRALELQGRALTAEERSISAEERFHGLEDELLATRRELNQRDEEVASLRHQLSEAAAAPPGSKQPGELLAGMLARGLAPIIDTARASAAAMIDEATKISEQRVGEAEHVMRALRDQGREMVTWWQGVHGRFEPMLSTLEQARTRMGDVSARIEEALAPAMSLLGVLKDQLGELAAAAEPPPFDAPLDAEGRIVDLRGEHDEGQVGDDDPTNEDVAAGTAVGLRRGARAWWPEVSPSIRSTGG
jgi:hypothetical protein